MKAVVFFLAVVGVACGQILSGEPPCVVSTENPLSERLGGRSTMPRWQLATNLGELDTAMTDIITSRLPAGHQPSRGAGKVTWHASR